MGLRYELPEKPSQAALPTYYLEVWVDDYGDIFFTIGSKRGWMMKTGKHGYTFTGKTKIISCYSPYDNGIGINHDVAKVAAFAFGSGNYSTVFADLGDRS